MVEHYSFIGFLQKQLYRYRKTESKFHAFARISELITFVEVLTICKCFCSNLHSFDLYALA